MSDTGDISGPRGIVLPARNACFDVAESLGLKYFLELDDDYTSFRYRYIEGPKLASEKIENLDGVFDAYLDFLDESQALTVCFGQGGDYMGGASCFHRLQWKRKAMNSFFCRTDRPWQFVGRINEDTNAYVSLGQRGELLCTLGDICLTQAETQAQSGGLTESYLDMGTYMKSFYSVMYCPSAVKVDVMGTTGLRLHHWIDWDKCTPKIISDKYKRGIA